MPQHVRVGTRASALALTQTGHVVDALATLGGGDLTLETVHVRTDGDLLTGSLQSLGGTGVFVTALRDALLDGRCDVAVHSLKDLPTAAPEGIALAAVPTREDLEEIVSSSTGTILVARNDDGSIIGSLTLVLFRTPTGARAWIEDVVVDQAARGQGAGEALVEEAIRLAAESGVRTVDLTSRPSREAANALYEKVGFRARETNVYRYEPT